MVTHIEPPTGHAAQVAPWYSCPPEFVAAEFGVDPAVGLPEFRAADLLAEHGPNTLPEEASRPGWQRLLDQYRRERGGGPAPGGQGTERDERAEVDGGVDSPGTPDRVEGEITAGKLVVGDVVLLAAGDQVPADGRLIAASALQIDESALTGESTPAVKDVPALPDTRLGPGDQTNMAFMNTLVTHGSGVMIVTATGARTELGRISGMLSTTATEQSPTTRQLNRLTLWIAAAAGLTMVVMFAMGHSRGQAWDALFVSAVSLAVAAIPEALPTVTQTILSLGGVDLAKRNAIVEDLPSVETLGFTSAINSDKTGTLTMNQMTVIEVVDPGNRYTVTGTGYSLDGTVQHRGLGGRHRGRDPAVRPGR